MAIDTKAKRMSMLSVCNPIGWSALFEVDGAIDADDRAVLLHIYAGNALGGAPADPATTFSLSADIGYTIKRKIAFNPTNTRPDSP